MGRKPSAKTLKAWREYCEEIRPTVTKLMIDRVRAEQEIALWFRQNGPPAVEGNAFVFDLKAGE